MSEKMKQVFADARKIMKEGKLDEPTRQKIIAALSSPEAVAFVGAMKGVPDFKLVQLKFAALFAGQESIALDGHDVPVAAVDLELVKRLMDRTTTKGELTP
jgi:hypothetical protein